MDFAKACNTITFEHTQIMFHLMGLPVGMVSLMTQLLHAPVAFCIQGVVVPDVFGPPVWAFDGGTLSPRHYLCC